MTCPYCADMGLFHDEAHPRGIPCDCAAGDKVKADQAARRAREMNAELPADQRDMLKLKGMI